MKRGLFVDNWREVLAKAWSIRLMAAAGLFSGLEVALPLIGDRLPVPAGAFAALSGLVVAAASIARLLAQSNLPEA